MKRKHCQSWTPLWTKLSGSAHEVARKGCRQQITNVDRTVRIRWLICFSPLQFTYERFSDKYRVNLLGKNSCLLSSADFFFQNQLFWKKKNSWIPSASNSLDPDQARLSVGPDLGPICLQRLSADTTRRQSVGKGRLLCRQLTLFKKPLASSAWSDKTAPMIRIVYVWLCTYVCNRRHLQMLYGLTLHTTCNIVCWWLLHTVWTQLRSDKTLGLI